MIVFALQLMLVAILLNLHITSVQTQALVPPNLGPRMQMDMDEGGASAGGGEGGGGDVGGAEIDTEMDNDNNNEDETLSEKDAGDNDNNQDSDARQKRSSVSVFTFIGPIALLCVCGIVFLCVYKYNQKRKTTGHVLAAPNQDVQTQHKQDDVKKTQEKEQQPSQYGLFFLL